jgi:hypothetical protein
MSSYRQTLQIALAGAQAPLPDPLAKLAAEWGESDGPAAALLQAAAMLAQAERCAKPLPKHPAPLGAVAPPEPLAPCSNDLAALLNQGLSEPNVWVMRDKSGLLVARREYLPHALLPMWLEFAVKHPSERSLLMACTGQRGPWLADLNPDWRVLLDREPDDASWERGSQADRIAWLTAQRRKAPEQARAALESAWAKEAPESREKLLACLAIGLSTSDEGLLETARTDKRKEVRRLALDLLAQLPESAFSKRMLARATSWLSFSPVRLLRGAKLDVQLASAYENTWSLDGIPEKTTRQNEGIGERANWLVEVLGYVPLDRVLKSLGLDGETWVRIIGEHEFAAALWAGSVLSSERHPRHSLLAALLTVPSAPLKAKLLHSSLAAARDDGHTENWLGPWLADPETDWPTAVSLMPRLDERQSRAVFKRLQAFVEARRGQPGYWASLLPHFSERAHPSVLAQWLAFLDPLGNEPYVYKSVDAAVAIAALRQRLHSFHPDSRSS